MATLSKTYGATIVTSTETVQYAGETTNNYFGGHRITMLAFNAPSALGTDEQVTNAALKCLIKADTTPDYDNITIGLINSIWTGGNTGYPGMYAACSGPTISVPLSAGLEEAGANIPVTGLIQIWAANPTAYSGLYLACSTLNLTRIKGTNCTVDYSTITMGAPGAPTSINLSGDVCEIAPTFSWSGASGGTNNPIYGYTIQFADSYNGESWGDWQHFISFVMTETNGSTVIPLPSTRGVYRKVRIRTNGSEGINSAWVEAPPFRYNSAPEPPIINLPIPQHRTYNTMVRFLITVGEEPDGQLVDLEKGAGGVSFIASSPGPYHQGKKLILQTQYCPYEPDGLTEIVIILRARDEMGVCETSNYSFKIVNVRNPNNIVEDGEFVAGGTRIRASHINDLREAIQSLRNAYSLPVFDWTSGDVIAGTTPLSGWKAHVEEMRTAINGVINKINTWDDTAEDCLVEVPEWIPITGTKPRADVMEQLRSVIASI